MASKDKPGSSEYEVGYGKPPRHSQFKKGRSGNPNGRPKGSLNLATLLERILHEKVVINENGQRREITKGEAALKQLVNKSAAGDLAAIKFMVTWIRYGEEGTAEAVTQTSAISDNGRKIVDGLLKRLGVKNGGNDEPDKR